MSLLFVGLVSPHDIPEHTACLADDLLFDRPLSHPPGLPQRDEPSRT